VEIHERSRGTYGAPRIQAELELAHGLRFCRKRIARLMRQRGLVGIHRRRARRRGGPRRLHPLFDDLVERKFDPAGPNQLWVADITQHMTGDGWLYLAVVLDAFSRRVVGWAMHDRAPSELVIQSLQMALQNRDPDDGVIHHSDQGAQYTALSFGKHLQKAGVLGSMGRVGSALDNAMAESFFASLQTELLDRQSWPTRDSLRLAIFDYLEVFYNRQRRHSSLEYLTPVDFERREQTPPDQASVAKLVAVH
jgi:putative transposase